MRKIYTILKGVVICLLLTTLVQSIKAETNDGHFWLQLRNKNVSMDEAVSHFDEWLYLPDGSTFELLHDETDQLGIRHTRYRQYVGGCEVQASMVIVHGKDGIVTSANGVVMEKSAQPKTASKLLSQSTRSTGEKLYLVQTPTGYRYATFHYDAAQNANVYVDAETGEVLKTVPLHHSFAKTIQGRSLYSGTVPFTVDFRDNLSYAMSDETRNIYTVDAHNAKGELKDYIYSQNPDGSVVYDRKRYIAEQCKPFETNDTIWTRSQVIEVSLDSVTKLDAPYAEVYLVLRDYGGTVLYTSNHIEASKLPYSKELPTIGGKLAFLNLGSFGVEVWQYNYLGDDIRLDSIGMQQLSVGTYKWNTGKSAGHFVTVAAADPAVDIHWGMQQVYDWYKTTLNRNSYDDKGGPIYNILFASSTDKFLAMIDENNAFANDDSRFNCFVMEYGVGDGKTMSPVVSIDVMAHEFTHLVTACTAGLEGAVQIPNYNFSPESAALNESFSDIVGISVKRFVKGSKATNNWYIGEEVMLQAPCIRDMSHRIIGNESGPIYYKGKDWQDGADEHINCAVQNYWFYLLCEGDFEVGVDSIGIEKALQIAYRNLTQYLTPTSNYVDAYKGSLQATLDLFGDDLEYDEVTNAWEAVGLSESTTAIRNVSSYTKPIQDNSWYNLQGQRVDSPSKPGIYIQNGKKIIIN